MDKKAPLQNGSPDFFSLQISEARRFFLDMNPTPSPLTVVSGGCEHCRRDYRIERSTFPYWSVEFVVRGRGHVRLGGKAFDLSPGTFFSYGPGIAHLITTDAKDPLVKFFIDFTGRRAESLLRDYTGGPGHVLYIGSPADLATIFEELIRNGMTNSRYTPALCALLMEAILIKAAETQIPASVSASPAFQTYQRCRRTIEEHALETRSLADLARRCHVDEAYICRLFRRFAEETPYRYLLRLQMRYAASRMLTPGTLVKQVAQELGFSDPYHFSRTFKSVLGLPPAEYARAAHARHER